MRLKNRFKKRNRKEAPRVYRSKMFVLTAIVCLVLVTANLWGLYLLSSRVMIRNEQDNSGILLDQTEDSICYITGQLDSMSVSLYSNPDTVWLMNCHRQASEYDYIRVMRRLSEAFIQFSPAVHSAYVYNGHLDRCFSSGNGINNVDPYVKQQLEQQAPELLYKEKPFIRMLGDRYVCTKVIRDEVRVGRRNGKKCSALIVNYDMSWLIDNINLGLRKDMEDSLILSDNQENEPFIYYVTADRDPGYPYDGEQEQALREIFQEEAPRKEVVWNGRRCLLIGKTVEPFGWKLAKLVPLKNLRQTAAVIRNQSFIINFAAIALILAIYYGVSNYLYRPIRRMLNMLPEYGKCKAKDEFSLVEDSYQKHLTELENLKKRNEEHAIALEEPIINRLLSCSSTLTGEELDNLLQVRKFQISFDRKFRVLVCCFDRFQDLAEQVRSQEHKVQLRSELRDIFEMCMEGGFAFDYSYSSHDYAAALIQPLPDRSKDLDGVLKRLQTEVYSALGFTISIAYSRELLGIRETENGFSQAMEALSYRIITGKQSIMDGGKMEAPRKTLVKYDVAYENRILEDITENRYRNAASHVPEFCRELSSLDAESIRIVLPFFMKKVKRILLTKNLAGSGGMDRISHIFTPENMQYLEDIPSVLRNVFEVLEQTQKQQEDQGDHLIDQILTLVEQEYRNPKMSASYLAQQLGIPTAKLGRIIKKHKNQTVPEFINDVRLNAAVVWIQNSNWTVSQISSLVGFQNESYFFRIFKEKYGMTPRQYEKNLRKKQEELS